MKKIKFEKTIADNVPLPKIGGKASIPKILWPKDDENKYMALVLTLPATFVNDHLQTNFPQNTSFSVFNAYSKEEDAYFLDKVIYNINDSEELKYIMNNTSVVYYENTTDYINLADDEIPAREIEIDNNSKDIMSCINDIPHFLQHENLSFENHQFIMQFYAGSFPENYQDILFLSDAVGYVFINKKAQLNKIGGIYFGQCT